MWSMYKIVVFIYSLCYICADTQCDLQTAGVRVVVTVVVAGDRVPGALGAADGGGGQPGGGRRLVYIFI